MHELSKEERAGALSSLIFIKEKWDGTVKGRACVDGSPQRKTIPKESAASPTVATESVFLTCLISAYEKRHNRSYDVPSAFVNTELDEEVDMVLRGDLAELLVKVAPDIYRKYITRDKKGKAILYVRLQKALYGLMRAALLFYRKLRKELEDYGFVINPEDPCVANKWIVDKAHPEGHQMMVILACE